MAYPQDAPATREQTMNDRLGSACTNIDDLLSRLCAFLSRAGCGIPTAPGAVNTLGGGAKSPEAPSLERNITRIEEMEKNLRNLLESVDRIA